ncbi:MAG: 3-deoxy-D-manno-octulosonic acid transferase [bacterium]
MIWFFYNILFAIGFFLMLPRFLYRMMRRGGYARDFGQRLARYSPEIIQRLSEGRRVWIHAVSVGEVFVALRVMREWRTRRPDIRFVLTTTTSTGHAIACKEIAAQDVLLYFPVDFPWITRRVMDLIDPQALVLIELELWPNLVRHASRRGVPILLVNGRISDHSFAGYRKLRFFTSRILPMIDLLCVQSDADRDRMEALGANPDRIRVMGSAKYDVAAKDTGGEAKARAVIRAAGIKDDDPILLGGSTWAGEEGLLLDAFKSLRTSNRGLTLVLAPRHVERAPAVLADIRDRGLSVARRTDIKDPLPRRPDVLLLDTTGELKDFYACADVIFIGKSLTRHGGQNIIEPALFGKPIVVGPNMENFRSVTEDFLAAKALVQVDSQGDLRKSLFDLFRDPAARQSMGARAAQVVRDRAGSIGRTLDLADKLVYGS